MTIAMSDGTTYENSLDMLFAKDMPSREETDRQQKMKDMDSTMPHDMRGPPPPESPTESNQLSEPSYKDQNDPYSWGMGSSMDRKGPAMVPLPEPKFHEIMDHLDYLINPEKIQAGPGNKDTTPVDPRVMSHGEYEQLNREGKFQSDLTPYPSHPEMQDRKHDFFNMMDNAYINKYPPQITPEEFGWYDQWQDMNKERTLGDYLELQKRHLEDSGMYQMSPKQLREKGIGHKSEDDTLPSNARQTAAETKEPSPYGETYDKFVEHLEAASKFLNPSFIPSAEEFRDAPWKEKLGFMIGTSMMMLRPTPGAKPPSMEGTPLEFWKGNAGKLDEQALEHYRKLDTPVAREEFSNMIKNKIDSASEGGETSTSNITQPEIRGMKEGSDWSEVITKPDGTKETVYDQAKIERLRNLLDNGLTFKEIGEKMDVSRNSVNSMVRRLKTMDAEEVTPSEKKANSPWSATEDKILTTWHKDPNSDLFETPALLKHRSEGAINARIKYLGLEKSAEEEASALPFVPKGAVRAPEKGSGSGPTVTGKSGVHVKDLELGQEPGDILYVKRGQLIPDADMLNTPDNKNFTPKVYGENVARRLISNWRTKEELHAAGITAEDLNALVEKHGPAFQEFQKLNPDRQDSSIAHRYMEKDRAIEKDLRTLERSKQDPYDKAVEAQKNRKDLKTIEGGKKDASLNWLGKPAEPGYRQTPWGFSFEEVDKMSPKEYSKLMNKTIESPAYREWINDFHAGKHNSNKFPEK